MNKKTRSATSQPVPVASDAAGPTGLYQARANRIFAQMSDINQLHFTSDMYCFSEYQHAKEHARKLEDQAILTINRQ